MRILEAEATHLLFADTGMMICAMKHPAASTESLELADPVDSPGASLKVLVVEDDRPTRLLLERMIRARGHDVHGCESAEQARDLLGQTFFPLIVLDIQLPGMSGLDFSRPIATIALLAAWRFRRPVDVAKFLGADGAVKLDILRSGPDAKRFADFVDAIRKQIKSA